MIAMPYLVETEETQRVYLSRDHYEEGDGLTSFEIEIDEKAERRATFEIGIHRFRSEWLWPSDAKRTEGYVPCISI